MNRREVMFPMLAAAAAALMESDATAAPNDQTKSRHSLAMFLLLLNDYFRGKVVEANPLPTQAQAPKAFQKIDPAVFTNVQKFLNLRYQKFKGFDCEMTKIRLLVYWASLDNSADYAATDPSSYCPPSTTLVSRTSKAKRKQASADSGPYSSPDVCPCDKDQDTCDTIAPLLG